MGYDATTSNPPPLPMLLIPVSHTRSACFAHLHKMLLISQNAMREAKTVEIIHLSKWVDKTGSGQAK